jgi:hypothetical protein
MVGIAFWKLMDYWRLDMDLERDIGGRETCGLSRQTGIARWFFGDELCDPAAGERLVLNGRMRLGFAVLSVRAGLGYRDGCRVRGSEAFAG